MTTTAAAGNLRDQRVLVSIHGGLFHVPFSEELYLAAAWQLKAPEISDGLPRLPTHFPTTLRGQHLLLISLAYRIPGLEEEEGEERPIVDPAVATIPEPLDWRMYTMPQTGTTTFRNGERIVVTTAD